RAVLARDAAPEHVAGVRRAHEAGALLAVERDRVGADLVAPEGALEALAQLARLGFERVRRVRLAHGAREPRRVRLREVDVALHLGARDPRPPEARAGMEGRIRGILAALGHGAGCANALVLDQPVAGDF